MKANDFVVKNPTLPPEDKPNTTMIKTLIILAVIGGLGWFLYKQAENGLFDDIRSQIQQIGAEIDEDDALDAIEDYLEDKYDDHCELSRGAIVSPPDGAIGGRYHCAEVAGVDVYAYATKDGDGYLFEDGYLFAKHFKATEALFTTSVRLYFPKGTVSLVNSNYGISTDFEKDIPLFDFIKQNGYSYAFKLILPQGTGININNLTALSRQLSAVFPNFQLDALYEEDETASDNSSSTRHIFTILCENGKAKVQMNH